jgi:hypothetical protein
MLKTAAAVAALILAASPIAYAQGHSADKQDFSNAKQGRLSAAEPDSFTDLRLEVLKAALQLTPDQEKYWPAIEDAIRTRAKHRVARLENLADRVSDAQDRNPVDLIFNRNPADFMHRRADALAQRSADLKRLGDAWQPLYQSFNADQKRRLGLMRLVVLRAVANRMDGAAGMQSYDDDEDE